MRLSPPPPPRVRRAMMSAAGHLVPSCAFERHPASIERHAEPGPIPTPGFDGITTWFPHLFEQEGDLLALAPEPSTEPPVALDPPPEFRPPPVPIRPADAAIEPGPDLAVLDRLAEPPAPEISDARPPPLEETLAFPPEPAALPVTRAAHDPFAILKAEPALPLQDAPLHWPGAALLQRVSQPDDSDALLWDAPAHAARRRVWPTVPPRLAIGLAVAACVAALVVAGVHYGPALIGSGQTVTAVFNAPMMVVRSAATGRVTTVAATAAQVVDPKSPLLTIHTDDGGADRPVFAGVHGMIRSVETVPGAALVAGAPLVRLQDCDRAFLTIPAGTKLQAGQTVQVKLPDQKPFAGKVRASAGVMEPPDSLVVGLEPGVVTASCPVGRSATVTPLAG